MRPIILSSPLTHIDWIYRDKQKTGTGPSSVRYMLDLCKDVGFSKIYWRCLDGGRALYKSLYIEGECEGADPDNYHAWIGGDAPAKLRDAFDSYTPDFDTLKEAVDYGHKIGLEIHAWVTINEDDHAWGITSKFSREHPQFRWVRKSGLPYNSQLSFAFEEVREYKLNLLREICDYEIDGLFLDWMRTGDVRNDPQYSTEGTADFGYEKPLVEGYQKKYGVNPHELPVCDPQWVKFRAHPQTEFMKEVKKLCTEKNNIPITILTHHPWSCRSGYHVDGSLNGLLVDLESWALEGLVDKVFLAGYFMNDKGGTPQKAFLYGKEIVNNKCDVGLYWWVPKNYEEFEQSLKEAASLNAAEILYWEADYIDDPAFSDGVSAMESFSQK